MSKTTSSAMEEMKKTMCALHSWFRDDTQFNDEKLELLRCLYPSTPTDLTRCVEHQCVKSKKVNVELAGSGKVLCYGFNLSKVTTFVDLQQQLHKLFPKYNRDQCDPTKTRLFTSHRGSEVTSLKHAKSCHMLVVTPVESMKTKCDSVLNVVKERYEKDVCEALETLFRLCKPGRLNSLKDSKNLKNALQKLKQESVFEMKEFQDLLKFQKKERKRYKNNCLVCGKTVSLKYKKRFVDECKSCCSKCEFTKHPKSTDFEVYVRYANDELNYWNPFLLTFSHFENDVLPYASDLPMRSC